MASTRRIIRVFLASPGDLQDERKLIRDVVVEFNDCWADTFGYQVELLGWEVTVSGFGRPQQLINADVDRCDLFLGMVWKRWGTPPGPDDRFTSGFQEEFERFLDRHERSENLDISLFFKRIPDEYLDDPGEDLKRVLAFRKDTIARRRLLFQDFTNAQDVATLARKSISAYVTRIREADKAFERERTEERRANSVPSESQEGKALAESPLSPEGLDFLDGLVDTMRQEDALVRLGAPGIARFRLLANAISAPGNQEIDLGVHDINILFSACLLDGLKLGNRERRALARLGFRGLVNENVPLWRWYAELADSATDVAVVSSLSGTDAEKTGALRVLEALSTELPAEGDRQFIIHNWLSPDSPSSVRSAALNYLATNGLRSDYAIVEQAYSTEKSRPTGAALECMIQILLRTGEAGGAQRAAVELQFESLDSGVLEQVLGGFQNLDAPTLMAGLRHRNARVRLQALTVLTQKRAIDRETAEELCGDSDPQVRLHAVESLTALGRSFSEKEVEDVLVRAGKKSTVGILGMTTQQQEQELLQGYRMRNLLSENESELTKRVEESMVHEDDAYFARADKYFAKHGDDLRSNVDDRFRRYFDEGVRRLENLLKEPTLAGGIVGEMRGLEDFSRKKLTRRGLNILVRKGKHEDFDRVRSNLKDGFAEVSILDVRYVARYGGWEDALLLLSSRAPVGRWAREGVDSQDNFQSELAKAVRRMGRRREVSELLALEMVAGILEELIGLCPASRFSKVSHGTLFALFDNESADVRRAAAMKVVGTWSARRVTALLKEYVGREGHRYYNVIHWLDLGASVSQRDARNVVRRLADRRAR